MLPPDRALQAWEELRDHSDVLDKTDQATFRMLPMVYWNLRNTGLEDPALQLLRGAYRQSWLRTRLVLRSAQTVIGHLRAARVEPVALKGSALLATAYPETALRPMHDVDILIPPGRFVRAFDALESAGWRPLRGSRRQYFSTLRSFHALPVIGPDSVETDLHRHMLEEDCYRGADARMLARLQQAELEGVRLTVPSLEDQVINACVHGVRWDPVPPLRWVLDVVMAVRVADAGFDWAYLEGESLERRVSLAMAAALGFARQFEPSIPESTIETLTHAAHGRLERVDFVLQQREYSASAQVGRYVTRYLRLSSHRSFRRKVGGFPSYLAAMWELEDPRNVPREGMRRVWAALRR